MEALTLIHDADVRAAVVVNTVTNKELFPMTTCEHVEGKVYEITVRLQTDRKEIL